MSNGLSADDAKKVAAAMLEALQAEQATAEKVKGSVGRILEGAGSRVLAEKVLHTPPDVWSGIWSSISHFFAAIWGGVVGALDSLVDFIIDLF